MNVSVPKWRYQASLRVARFVAIALSTVDAVVSFKGLLEAGYPLIPSIAISVLVFVIQITVGLFVASGIPVVEWFVDQFFSTSGWWGWITMAFGISILIAVVSVFLVDCWTNYKALSASKANFDVVSAIFSIFLSLGDEFINLVTDQAAKYEAKNAVKERKSNDDSKLSEVYLQARWESAQQQARRLGEEEGERWYYRK